MDATIPPPPDGYTLQGAPQGASGVPPPPPGYQMVDASNSLPTVTVHASDQAAALAPADRAIAIQQTLGASPLGIPAALANYARTAIDANTAPDSRLRGFVDTVADNAIGAPVAAMHHAQNIPVGLAQLGAHAAAGIGDAISGAPQQSMSGLVTGQAPTRAGFAGTLDNAAHAMDQFAQNREATYQNGIPTNIGSVTGATVGEIAPWLVGAGELKAAGLIPQATTKLGNIVRLAAGGATMGAAQPVTEGNYANQKAIQVGTGALAGPIVHGLGAAARGLGNGVKDIAARLTNAPAYIDSQIAQRFGTDPATLNALRNAQTLVPGAVPTAGQAIGTPAAVSAERVLRNGPASAITMAQAGIDRNAAQVQAIKGLAGDDAAMAAAKTARSDATQPYIQASLSDSRPITRWSNAAQPFDAALSKNMVRGPDLRALEDARGIVAKVRGGSMQEDDALEAMKELGDSVSQKYAPVFQQAMDAINHNMVDPSGVLNALATTRNSAIGLNRISQGGSSTTVADALDKLSAAIKERSNINGLIGTDQLNGVQKQAAAILGNASPSGAVGLAPAKNQIVDAIDAVAPGYRDYLATYAKHSQPINDMQAGQALLDPVSQSGLNAGGDPQLAISAIRSALRADDNATYPMSKGARQKLEDILASKQQDTITNNPIAAAGPATAADTAAQNNSKLGGAFFGDPVTGKPGAATRTIGMALGGATAHALGLGPLGDLAGAGIGNLLPEAIGKLNAKTAQAIAQRASDAGLTLQSIQRYLLRQNIPPSKVDGIIGSLSKGSRLGLTTQPARALAPSTNINQISNNNPPSSNNISARVNP